MLLLLLLAPDVLSNALVRQLVPAAAAVAAAADPGPEPWAAGWVLQGLTSHLIGKKIKVKIYFNHVMKSEQRKQKGSITNKNTTYILLYLSFSSDLD